ncbi:MAG: hypothetical protein JO235_21255 [Chroococcidiopsidaceae cyanobacterium CP_BM_RX_35]|nr:hypothetical protein [Chroococcidiopsidaceae cyanobacterium CP_BM_RX_35]
MNNSDFRIPKDIAPDVFALASRLHNQNQGYSLAELMQAGAEAHIPPELIRQALQQIQQAQIQARERQQRLKLVLTSGLAGAALALGSFWAYNKLTSSTANIKQPIDLNNADRNLPILANERPLAPPGGMRQPYTDATSFSGEVETYLLNPEGLVDGLLLSNGLQVKFPPHLTHTLVTTVQPGNSVTVVGDPGTPSNLGQEIHAFSITNTSTQGFAGAVSGNSRAQAQRTVVDQPPAYPPPLPPSNYSNLSVAGTVQHWIVGHRGEIRGVILSSKAQVRFPPHVGDQLFNIAKAGDSIQAQGFGTNTSYGPVLEATSITVNGQPVNYVPEGPKFGKRQKEP